MRRPRLAVGARLAVVVLGWLSSAAAAAPPPASDVTANVQVLDVPYVPQSGVLCGGAALAMVLRYWGESGVLAEDFAPLVQAGQDGIRTGDLADAVADRGWTPLLLPGRAEVAEQLARGRPVIALLQVGDDAYHYVVLVAWFDGQVVVHDPKVRPFRVVSESRFLTEWSGSDGWALLVLPPPGAEASGSLDSMEVGVPAQGPTSDECSALVEQGILLFEQGDGAGAEREFLAARAQCPGSAAPLRELAGLRFRAGDWAGASRMAERALALEPDDPHAWRILAGSRFLADDLAGALDAWNHLSEPRNDLTRIEGLLRIRYSAVAGQLELPPGELLTPGDFRRAQRRLAELPAQDGYRLGLRPMPDGVAQIDVAVVERPLVSAGPWDLARAGTRALVDHQVTLDVASPTGNAELWTATWRWWKQRPRVSLTLAAPTAGRWPGIWFVEGFWERQTYAATGGSAVDVGSAGALIREERRRTALSFANWIGPALRMEAGAALDAWDARGNRLALKGSIETRWLGDRLAATVLAEQWMSVDGGAPFATGGVSLQWCPDGAPGRDAWQGDAGFSSATTDAPLALWSGAGTGPGRDPLLRAHPLLDDGIVAGPVFGRSLVHATIERQTWPWQWGPLQLGAALFVDGAKAWNTGQFARSPLQVDGGVAFLLRNLGIKGQLRIDFARGFSDGDLAASITWRTR